MQKSIANYCNHSSYPTRATSHAFVRLFLDLLLRAACKQNTLWIGKPCQDYGLKKPCQNCKNKERTNEPEIQHYYWLNMQSNCKIIFCVRKADQLVTEKYLLSISLIIIIK